MSKETLEPLQAEEFLCKRDFKAIFLDVSASWLSNGWDVSARKKLARLFGLDYNILELKHLENYRSYQQDKISFEAYIELLSSGQKSTCPKRDISNFVHSKLNSNKVILNYLKRLKNQYKIAIIAINNGSGWHDELPYPLSFLKDFVDIFISPFANESCLSIDVSLKRVLKVTKLRPWEIICFDSRSSVINKATNAGMKGVLHDDIIRTKSIFKQFGIKVNI